MTGQEQLEKQKRIEDKVKKVLDGWNRLKKAIAYKAIRNEGDINMSVVDSIIRQELEKEK